MVKSGELPVLAKSERALKIMSLGKSSDVEYIEGKEHHKPSGGGKRVAPHIYNDELKDVSEE